MLTRNSFHDRATAKFDWWQDWRGECVAIVASGLSTTRADVETLRDRIHVIAIKKNVDLCPWADAVYGCDAAWWQSVRGLPDYRGLKMSWADGGGKHFDDLGKFEIEKTTDKILMDEPGVIGSGRNSGFQTINISAQFGATGILLIGFDCIGHVPHWYGRNNWPMANNPAESNYSAWKKAFAGAADDLKHRGIDVVNASPISALRCFRRRTVAQALAGWGL